MNKVGIIGLGLIGGSIAKALKNRLGVNIIAMNRSEQSLKDAMADGVIDDYTLQDLSLFSECDIIFICTSVDKIPGFVQKLIPYIKSDCIITDVGSTKKQIYDEMLKFNEINYIGGHPMAGSEQTGYKSSKEYLLENAYYIITPAPSITDIQIDSFVNLVKTMGAIPIRIAPEDHDYTVAAVSHVPHVIASALVKTVQDLDNDKEYMHTLAAGGFKDITRIASSSPEIWSSICFDNRQPILDVINSFKNSLSVYEHAIINNDTSLYSTFRQSKDYRDTFTNINNYSPYKSYEIYVDVDDRPGIIATIATMLSVNNINIKNIGIVNNREYTDGVLHIMFEHQEDKENSIRLLKQMNFTIYNS